MTKQLVLIDGGTAGEVNSTKAQWLDAWYLGLKRAALLPPAIEVKLISCGTEASTDSEQLQQAGSQQPELGGNPATAEASLLEFRREVLEEVAANRDVLDFHLKGTPTAERVQSLIHALTAADGIDVALILKAIDAAHRCLTDSSLRARVEGEFRQHVDPSLPVVIVGHSVGSILAYELLSEESRGSWNVPLLVTLGSPLGIAAIRNLLPIVRVPRNVERWCNARDAADIVAMFPLDYKHFPIKPIMPSILDKSDVRNRTDDHHGVAGYLGDADVAKWIHYALR